MHTARHHIGRLTGDSVLKMLNRPGALFVPGLTCFDCGATYVIGTLNLNDYPVSTGHKIAVSGAAGTVDVGHRVRPTPVVEQLQNRQ